MKTCEEVRLKRGGGSPFFRPLILRNGTRKPLSRVSITIRRTRGNEAKVRVRNSSNVVIFSPPTATETDDGRLGFNGRHRERHPSLVDELQQDITARPSDILSR
jgi:hypothetical protein